MGSGNTWEGGDSREPPAQEPRCSQGEEEAKMEAGEDTGQPTPLKDIHSSLLSQQLPHLKGQHRPLR